MKRPESNPVCLSNIFRNYIPAFLLLLSGINAVAQLQRPLTTGKNQDINEEKVKATIRQHRTAIQFTENKGQQGLPSTVVAYCSTPGEFIFIEKNRLRVVVLHKQDEYSPAGQVFAETKQFQSSSIDILFEGSRGFSSLQKKAASSTVSHYLSGNRASQNISEVRSYSEIILRNIYKGVSLRLYSNAAGQFEFDWILEAGVNPSVINMHFSGQQSMLLQKDGSLKIGINQGNFNMHIPESYYVTTAGKKKADLRFSLKSGDCVGFTNHSRYKYYAKLVIDPQLLWGTFFDGARSTFDEYLYAIDYNHYNELLYCAGAASLQVSTAYAAALAHGYDSTFSAIPDALVYAITSDGNEIMYMTYLGGAGTDVAYGIATDENHIYVCGYTSSGDFPLTKTGDSPSFDSTLNGTTDGFIVQFNESLSELEYSSFIGGPGADRALTVRAPVSGVFYVSMNITDTLPHTVTNYLLNSADNSFGGSTEAWIGKFSNLNTLDFGTYIGGTSDDQVNDFQVLNNGSVVFIGTTSQISEVSGTVSSNATGKDVLFGRINKPTPGNAYFSVLDKLGGSGTDEGWGITCLGDTVSVIVGQTSSTNFPLGTGTAFQTTRAGGVEGYVGKIKNDGTGGYKASYVGGTGDDILVSVRLISLFNNAYLLCFGSTKSTNLSARNFNSESFFSSANAGGLDMMFLVTDLDISTKVYLSYIGGSGNDYLGLTGVPYGSNHLYYNPEDTVLFVGTTSHSSQATHSPQIVGRGWMDVMHYGVSVFDSTKNNGTNDTHLIIAISTKTLVELPMYWQDWSAREESNCAVNLSWTNENEAGIERYQLMRSYNGNDFTSIASFTAGQVKYNFTDLFAAGRPAKVFYRVVALKSGGGSYQTSILAINPCNAAGSAVQLYPSVTRSDFNLSGIPALRTVNYRLDLYNSQGQLMQTWPVLSNITTQHFSLGRSYPPGMYILTLTPSGDPAARISKKLIIQ